MNKNLFTYPNYKKIEIQDKEVFNKYCSRYASYSDFNLLSLLSWDAGGTYTFSILNDNLLIRIRDYLGEVFFYSILGEKLIDESLLTILKETGKLSFVPETVITMILDEGKFKIDPDRDDYDYILSTEKITKLEGREFKHLRRDVHRFNKVYPSQELRILDLSNETVKNALLSLTEKWYGDKVFDHHKQEEEKIMFEKFMKYSIYFNCVNLGLFVEGKLVAYIFSEILDDKVVMSHFGVADKDLETGSYMMEYLTAKYFSEKGFKFQNQQQDAGLPGLRAAKLFYNPEYFLKKYTISAK